MKKLNLLGLQCGVGSMMIGAKDQNWNILGNIESRKFFSSNTFENYFNCKIYRNIEDFNFKDEVHLTIGHPSCGNYSSLSRKKDKDPKKITEEILRLFEDIKKINPWIFVIEQHFNFFKNTNLKDIENLLTNYQINCIIPIYSDYGNPQKNRKRVIYIGQRKDLKLNFNYEKPPVKEPDNISKRLEGLNEFSPNHTLPKDDDITPRFRRYHLFNLEEREKLNISFEDPLSYKEFKEWLNSKPLYEHLLVFNRKGNISKRIGSRIISKDYFSPTVTGNNRIFLKEYLRPLTVREAARIQGFPDNFLFLGKYPFKEIGKAVPIEFSTDLTLQIKKYLDNLF